MEKTISFNNEDLPALHNAANTASLDAQSNCLWLFRAELSFIIIASVSTSLSIDCFDYKKLLAGITAGAIVLSLGATVSSRLWKQDKKWYSGRALAESVKSLSWRFMTGSEPYLSNLKDQEAESHFLKSLLDMLEQVRDVDTFSVENYGKEKQITDKMRTIRHMPLQDRLAVYVENRICDQRSPLCQYK